MATVDNPFLPFTPGTRMIYEGPAEEGFERVVVEVTRDTRKIAGVNCLTVTDKVTVDGVVIEDTVDWYAQDGSGAVWYFGEDTKEVAGGKVSSTEGSWLAGVDGAQPGIAMPANPRVGDRYRQEYAPGEAEDRGEVLSLTEAATVPFGTFSDMVMTKDDTPLESGVAEHKYYARGVGLVLTAAVAGPPERVELVRIEQV